jgi:hypothetical protein
VTQTAVFDSDFNVLGPERSEVNVFEHHRLFRRLRNPCHRVPQSGTCAGLDGRWLVAALSLSGHWYSFQRLRVECVRRMLLL